MPTVPQRLGTTLSSLGVNHPAEKGDQGHLRSELVQCDLEARCLPEASLQKAKPQRIKGLHMGIK